MSEYSNIVGKLSLDTSLRTRITVLTLGKNTLRFDTVKSEKEYKKKQKITKHPQADDHISYLLLSTDKPLKPTILEFGDWQNGGEISKGGNYTLQCYSNTHGSYTEKYFWTLDTKELSDCTKQTCKVCTL